MAGDNMSNPHINGQKEAEHAKESKQRQKEHHDRVIKQEQPKAPKGGFDRDDDDLSYLHGYSITAYAR